MSHYNIYLKFLDETKEAELELGNFAYELSKLYIDIPQRMRMTQAFNIIGRQQSALCSRLQNAHVVRPARHHGMLC